jgi:hypothetical protein
MRKQSPQLSSSGRIKDRYDDNRSYDPSHSWDALSDNPVTYFHFLILVEYSIYYYLLLTPYFFLL